MSPPAMSRHLRVLRDSGLVAEERRDEDARVRVLRLRSEPFDELKHWIGEVERFWTGQLAAFKAHTERRRRPAPRRR
jgi:DNA-binding transcriptional ArsR family regulator